ncbi:MAG: signal peptidase I [Chloroflexota bacterium]
MKRAIALASIIAVCAMAFLSIRGSMPFMPIFGSSMEPTLQSGNLLLIEPIDPKSVKVGDIIVYSVPRLIREYYNYPPTVSHRVIEVKTDHPGLRFRTKGDNAGEDPFSVRPDDIRGTVGDQIPYLGLPLLFFQSQQGTIFVIIALSLLALFLYTEELSLGSRKLQTGIFSPVIRESHRTNRVLVQKIEGTEQRMNSTEQALEKFSVAVAEYAQHLASHTSAIQGLAEASHELKNSAAEQNRVLAQLIQNGVVSAGNIAPPPPTATPAPLPAPQAAAPKEKTAPPGCIKSHRQTDAKEIKRLHAEFQAAHGGKPANKPA